MRKEERVVIRQMKRQRGRETQKKREIHKD